MAGRGRGDGQEGPFWGDLAGPNPTDRAKKGVKCSVLVEADGGPLVVVIAGANVRDDKLLAQTLDAVVLERPKPTEEAPQHLCLDKGYDNRGSREAAEERGYVPHIRRIGKEKLDGAREKRHPARRWMVECTLAWLSKCRALLVCYDKKASNYLGMIKVLTLKAVFIDAINAHREKMEQSGFPSRLKGPWAKMEAYIARLTLILAMARAVGEEADERVETGDVLFTSVLIDYFKNLARHAYVVLYGEKPDGRLTEDVAEFLKVRGGHFKDEPTSFYGQWKSDHKGPRSDELSKRIRAIAKRSPAAFTVNTKNIWKDGKSSPALELALGNCVNGVKGDEERI